ncbi:viaA [Scenedesmus sp. PABB004]|nr:viaA [Scenedesmus sp. PABB004]
MQAALRRGAGVRGSGSGARCCRRASLPRRAPPPGRRARLDVRANYDTFSSDLLGPHFHNRAGISEEVMQGLIELPGTTGLPELRSRAEALTTWKLALQRGCAPAPAAAAAACRAVARTRGRARAAAAAAIAAVCSVLPDPADVEWPVEPFKTKFIVRTPPRGGRPRDSRRAGGAPLARRAPRSRAARRRGGGSQDALRGLEMARFTRRYPVVLETLMKQMLGLVHDFETKLLEAESKRQQQQQRPPPQAQRSPHGQEQQEQQEQQGDEEGEQEGQPGGMTEQQTDQMTQEEMEEALKESMAQAGQAGQAGKQIQITLEEMEGGQAGKAGDEQSDQDADDAMAAEVEAAAEQIVAQFEQGMAAVMDNLEKAQLAFDDLSELLEGQEGFALSQGTWQRDGWRELDDLRKKLESLKELRDLVRSLGRSGGKGPLRRAPEELEAARFPPGVVRSPLQPEEVRGLARSGDLSRMLPSEMALLAHGWPRKGVPRPGSAGDAGGGGGVATQQQEQQQQQQEQQQQQQEQQGAQLDEAEYYLPGAHAARMLHRVRRAERMLLSYERCGWLDDTPSRLTGRQEIRPAAEMGPIILCLDTSGSMRGAREVVAKALALECMRGAHRQQRPCYLYAFSGPDQVQELELSVDLGSLDKLLEFLSCSFMGGTDVDRPLQLSLERLQKAEWQQADILMVTDGEVAPPSEALLEAIAAAHEDLGLEVHGLLVSSQVSESMRALCTHLHVFKSWSAVGGESWNY